MGMNSATALTQTFTLSFCEAHAYLDAALNLQPIERNGRMIEIIGWAFDYEDWLPAPTDKTITFEYRYL
jgi:hypothetical protein